MRAASLCVLALGLATLQTAVYGHTRQGQIGERQHPHPSCGIDPSEYRRVARAANFDGVPRGFKREELHVHSRLVRTVPKKFYKSKRSRVPREVPKQPHESEEVPLQQALQLPPEYVKQAQPPPAGQETSEYSKDGAEVDKEGRQAKVIPATPLFTDARYQMRPRKAPQGPFVVPQPVDPRVFQKLQQKQLILARPLNRAQLFQRIHRDDQNFGVESESTTAVNEETCPDGQDQDQETDADVERPDGLAAAGYNRTAPNSIQEVHKVAPGKDQSYGLNHPMDQPYGLNLSGVGIPAPARPGIPPQQTQPMPVMQHART